MPDPLSLSVIIIAKNESAMIGDCLRSVQGLASQVIVVDSGSTDGTPELCGELGATVVVTDWPGFGPQKNRALALATGDWVLSLDADERLGPELRGEIDTLLRGTPACDVYRMPRRSSFCGRFMRHSGWWPDPVVRLWRRGCGRFSDDLVHERLLHEGKAVTLFHPIIHFAVHELSESLAKMNAYSTAGARSLAAKGREGSVAVAALRALWTFLRTYFLKLGVLDGREGFVLAVLNAEGTFHKYAKLALRPR